MPRGRLLRRVPAWLLGLTVPVALIAEGCSSTKASDPVTCASSEKRACEGPNGCSGVLVCQDNGQFGECTCEDDGGAGASGQGGQSGTAGLDAGAGSGGVSGQGGAAGTGGSSGAAGADGGVDACAPTVTQLFYDDFNRASIGSSLVPGDSWTIINAMVQGGALVGNSGGAAYTQHSAAGYDARVRFKVRLAAVSDRVGVSFLANSTDLTDTGLEFLIREEPVSSGSQVVEVEEGTESRGAKPATLASGVDYYVELTVDGGNLDSVITTGGYGTAGSDPIMNSWTNLVESQAGDHVYLTLVGVPSPAIDEISIDRITPCP